MNGLKVFYTSNQITAAYILLWPLLALASLFYAAGVGALKALYRAGILSAYRSRVKVISVGGITLGGSGKTPFVEYLARALAHRGLRPAILSRGYKRPGADGVQPDEFAQLGDEGCLLKENLGPSAQVFVRADRAALARELEGTALHDVFILDDGFQHWRLRRDCDVVVLDASCPFGRPWVLPLGHLREGRGALRRADIFVLTRCDEAPAQEVFELEGFLKATNPRAAVVRSVHAPYELRSLSTGGVAGNDRLKGQEICLLAGIANPRSLARAAQGLGARIVLEKFYEDHHVFREEEFAALEQECLRQGVKTVVTTQKDGVRLRRLEGLRRLPVEILELRITLKIIEGQEVLDERLDGVLGR